MKKNKWALAALAVAAVIGLTVSSCKKSSTTTTTNEETSTATDNNTAEHIVSDMTAIAAQSSDGTSGLASYRSTSDYEGGAICGLSCATVTRSGQIITITFNGSACLDGKTRTGSIIINYSGSAPGAVHYRDPGFSCTVTTSNYVVNGFQVNVVNKTITNTTPTGFNPAVTNETWSIAADVNIVRPSGGTINWNCNRTKTLLNTSDTSIYHGSGTGSMRPITWSKARVGLTGSANGTSANGNTFSASVVSQLIRDFGQCNISGFVPLIQGTLDFTPAGHPTRVIDYGNGTCDLDATITVNGVTTHFTL